MDRSLWPYTGSPTEVGDIWFSTPSFDIGVLAPGSTEIVALHVGGVTWPRSAYFRQANNVRQFIGDSYESSSGFPIGPSRYYDGTLLSDGIRRWTLRSEWQAVGINNAGHLLMRVRSESEPRVAVLEGPQNEMRGVTSPLGGTYFYGWNDFEQTVVVTRDLSAYVWNTRTGETDWLDITLINGPSLNNRGCVAGSTLAADSPTDNPNYYFGDLLLICNGAKTLVEKARPGVRHTGLQLNDRGWLLFNSAGQWRLWDGDSNHLVRDLLPAELRDRTFSIAGPTNDGTLQVTIEQATYRMTLEHPLEPLTEVLRPEAGGGLSGYGEYLGCEAMTGWIFDANRPYMRPGVELYEDNHLIGAALARPGLRTDGVYGYHVDIPQSIVKDGKPHFFNVRFAGTKTAIDDAWGTITCPAAIP